MPAIITHDTFGSDVYKILHDHIGETHDERHAFLLGNQGPDPLFYLSLVPHLRRFSDFGNTMHDKKPNELLLAFKQALSILNSDEIPVGRAYLLGFVSHYTLDSTLHPLVYMNQYQLCDAGVEGLSREHGSEVHAAIESEFDEMVLYTKKQQTVAEFSPAAEILHGSDFVLETVSKMYVYVAMTVYGLFIPKWTFVSAVRSFRRTEPFFHSRTGLKRALLGHIEELFRPYSFVRSMSPRAQKITQSIFDNHQNDSWENPFTGEMSTVSFWDLYHSALKKARTNITEIEREDFDLVRAANITNNLNFSGDPVVAILTIEEAS
ncbi:MAG: zinc dependent phospholipase C family protein [Eggerthellaceae bacterium]|jgi:hypothetical protein|nr:zinc dependent phospholipase C family protein [Eggerthellaceae bacterium]MDR2721559.1 zinc dependent phospholipase C family protein [Coriobacteriaceae bacterium]